MRGDVPVDAHAAGRPAGLLQMLMAVVRPEFRRDVLVFDPRDPVFGGPACAVPGCVRGVRGRGLCDAHHQRWCREGKPDLDRFVATTDSRSRSQFGKGTATGAVPAYECQVSLAALAPQLKLEAQYLLQCRRDEQLARSPVYVVGRMVRLLAGLPVTSLLDRDEQTWRTCFGRPPPKDTGPRALVIYGFRKLEDLADNGWETEYPRDIWRLRFLGGPTGGGSPSRLRFDRIPQPWLKDLAKRWVRWRLSAGLGTTAAARCVTAVTRFAQFLASPLLGVDRLADVDRSVLERYLADLHAEFAGRPAHRSHIGLVNSFIQTIRQHRWDPSLPATTTFYPEDYPKGGERLPRAVAEHVMVQVEHSSNLDRWDNPAYQLITLILIRCGLRVSDALKLPFDCIAVDADEAPYLRYYNHKMNREALVPIDEQLQQLIGEQQQRVRDDRWPGGVPVLFPRPLTNPDGHKPIGASTYRQALYRWLHQCDIRDEHRQPVHLTPHQWRHSLGTRLINRDVPQEVVRKILDHDSHAMTAHYARLSDTTVRRHWEQAHKVNVRGEAVTIDPDGPLAEASWAKQRLSRATQALPNGYCGLPVVKTCPHANACLTCPVFITTTEFLPQHRHHHQQVLQIITAAEARGQQRMVEMNRQVADNLNQIITALEDSGTGTQEASADAF